MSMATMPGMPYSAEYAVRSYLQVQDGVTLQTMQAAFVELDLGYSPAAIEAAVARLAQEGSVVWSGQIWLEKRAAVARLEQAA